MNIRRSIAIAAAAALALSIAACSQNGDGANEQEDPKNGETSSNVLTIASNADVQKTLDRFTNFGFGGDDTGNLWGDPLVTSDHHQNYEPGLATAWEASEDGIRWTFTLRESVTFSSGNPFTSADVAATFDRIRDDESLTGRDAWAEGYDHAETPDDLTVVIVQKNLMPTFLDEVGRVPIIDSAAFEADPDGYFLKPSGTGAFAVDTFDGQTGEGRFTKNEDWWGWTDDNATNVDAIVYKSVLDDSTRAATLQAGTADIATQISADVADALDTGQFAVQDVEMDTHMHIGVQAGENEAFSDRNLREALSLSVDRQGIVDGIFSGSAIVADYPIPATNLGYEAGRDYVHDPGQAAQLVSTSTYDGSPLTLIYTASSFPRADEVAQVIQSGAAEAGITLQLEPLDQAAYTERRSAGDFDLILGSFAATAGDPQVEVSVIIAFDIFGSHYDNAELHDLAVSAGGIADRTEREVVLNKVFNIEAEEFAPFIYLYQPITKYGMRNAVKNLTVYADGSANYKLVTFE
ncbi:MAG: ABC transporter substrate-binding protein [Bifidobacteriaceae bacterium]|jgi:peptide/nickel transport system substrate-binding protein/glutathione transport system substrate-binding protein|nr:ABC transporter substrate-binding protein [Bifidobacteriaceae bacterium]